MKINLYSVKDAVSGTFRLPFPSENDASATRAFKNVSLTPGKDNDFYNYRNDMSLFHQGVFDDVTGEIESDVYFIVNGGSFIENFDAVESENADG